MPIKHLIFDFYGTLGDTDPNVLRVPRGELLQFGRKRWMVEDKPPGEWFDEYCADKELDCEELWKEFLAMEDTFYFFPGIKELLEEFRDASYKLHILSNTGNLIHDTLAKYPAIKELFSTINCSYEIGAVKPDLQAFKTVLERLDAAPEECMMIGDSKRNDIEPATRLGMMTVHFSGRNESVEDLRKKLEQVLRR